MIDLTKLPPDDAERIAYAEGFTGVGALFARIGDLEHALQIIADSEEYHGDSFVCDFDSLQSVARNALEALK